MSTDKAERNTLLGAEEKLWGLPGGGFFEVGTQSESLCLYLISGDIIAQLHPRQGTLVASRESPCHPTIPRFIHFKHLTGRAICPLVAFTGVAVSLPSRVNSLCVYPAPGGADRGLTPPLTGLNMACMPRATAFLICLLIRVESLGVTFLTITCVRDQVSAPTGATVWSSGDEATVYTG